MSWSRCCDISESPRRVRTNNPESLVHMHSNVLAEVQLRAGTSNVSTANSWNQIFYQAVLPVHVPRRDFGRGTSHIQVCVHRILATVAELFIFGASKRHTKSRQTCRQSYRELSCHQKCRKAGGVNSNSLCSRGLLLFRLNWIEGPTCCFQQPLWCTSGGISWP